MDLLNKLLIGRDDLSLRTPYADAGPTNTAESFFNRRRLLLGGLAAMWASAGRADPIVPSPTRWLVHRITMGLTSEELALADSLGFTGYLEYHLNYGAINDSAMDTQLAGYTTLNMQPYELVPLTGGSVRNDLIDAAILRAVFSKRQLLERMTEFWTDHFNIDINNGLDQQLKTIDDRDVIRANALGTFPNLLSASAHSPAMLYYLDNQTSTAGNPNENYARELMELHTLGVEGGYTQADVVDVARCFTGWGLYNASSGNNSWSFKYTAGQHDNGTKTVLGHQIPANKGQLDIEGRVEVDGFDGVLRILANHPYHPTDPSTCAKFISKKLCKRFWGYDPPQSLIDAVAATFKSTGGDIKEMLRTLLNNTDTATAPPKYKRPFHLFASAMRSTGTTIPSSVSALRTQLISAGHVPFNWGPPDGYPDTLEAWVGLILPRWNFGASLLNGNISQVSVNIDTFFNNIPNTAQDLVNHIDSAMFGGAMAAAEKDRIRLYLLPDPPSNTRRKDAVGLAIAAPGYQWY